MSNTIFRVQDDDTLRPLEAQEYVAEERLQRLLAQHPRLLAGGQINEQEPRRWLLISREQGIPDVEKAGDRWALDHLFLDQRGTPTLVETKRSSDTRLRRQVVGQMLDYAANAVRHWPVDRIRADFEARCQEGDIDPGGAFEEAFGEDHPAVETPEAYWQDVEDHLEAGRPASPPHCRRDSARAAKHRRVSQ